MRALQARGARRSQSILHQLPNVIRPAVDARAVPALVVTAGLAWQVVLFLTGGLGALVLFLTGARLRPATPGE